MLIRHVFAEIARVWRETEKLCRQRATNANDYCKFKFIISPFDVDWFTGSWRLGSHSEPQEPTIGWHHFSRLRSPGWDGEKKAQRRGKHEFICECESIIQSRNINFFCQDSPSAINEIFMMFTQVYGAFFRVEVLEGELIRLRPLLFAARTVLIVFTGGLKWTNKSS